MKLSKKYAKADQNTCVACGACKKECPKNAIGIFKGCYAVINQTICVGCAKCAKVCPTGRIEIVLREVAE